ncbi:MAG: FMN-dependent NADH-azoreductase [Xanthomonadaceae bacterium]|nr:FMN-dependent NADH-azoreductase [Xanthomonadaceae bacterium]
MSTQHPTLLQINTSLFAGNGQSSQLAERFVADFLVAHPGTVRVLRDVASDPIPHLDGARFSAFVTPAESRDAAQNAVIAHSDALIAELKAADVVVLGLPMYNFGVPSQLKSYFDHIARAGETFRYTANGPVGLVTGKKVYVFATRGGLYQGTALDSQTTYVRDFLRFIGLDDVEFVYAEGLAIGPEQKEAGLAKARDAISRLAA